MSWVSLAVVGAAALAAGCGGSGQKAATTTNSEPLTALLNDVQVEGDSVRFSFESAPSEVKVTREPRSALSECGSGKRVAVAGTSFLVVHFVPAASAAIEGEKVTPTYTGPNRLSGPGPVLEAVKMCDFESDLGWAIGLEQRLPWHVDRDGSSVTVEVG